MVNTRRNPLWANVQGVVPPYHTGEEWLQKGPTSVHTEGSTAQTQGDERFGLPEKRDSWFDPPVQKKEAILQECICHSNALGRMPTLAYGQIYL